jgi:hypothetical protein
LLNEAIDRIAGLGSPPQDAQAVAAELTRRQLSEAAQIHLATLLALDIEGTDGTNIDFGGLTVRMIERDAADAVIRYEDVDAGFDVEGVTLTRGDGPTRLASLLSLLVFAREGSDGLVYLPSKMRNARITDVADRAGASERFVRHLITHYRKLADKVAA